MEVSASVRQAQSIRTTNNVQLLIVKIPVKDDRSAVSSHNCGVIPTSKPFSNNLFGQRRGASDLKTFDHSECGLELVLEEDQRQTV